MYFQLFFLLDPCTISQCGTNAVCLTQNHQALCSCPPGLSGDPLTYCQMPSQSCTSASDCGEGGVCVGGICASKCGKSPDDCLPNELCDQVTTPFDVTSQIVS